MSDSTHCGGQGWLAKGWFSLKDRAKAVLALTAIAILASCVSGATGGVAPSRSVISGVADTVTGDLASITARADQAWLAEDHPAATILYQAIVARDPSPPSVAILRLATLLSWENKPDEAVPMFRRYVALEPHDTEGRLGLGRALAWGGSYSDAIAVYDSVLVADSAYRDAAVGRAETLAWAGRFRESLSAYERWLAIHPSDREASLSYARTLAWSGRLNDAERLYARLSSTGDVTARAGVARVIGLRGDLARSEREWRRIVESEPGNAEALTGLGQILRWQGRPEDAEAAVQRALRADPKHSDARALLRFVRADLKPQASVRIVSSNDIDQNRVIFLQAEYVRRAWWNGTVGARYGERYADLRDVDAHARWISLSANWRPGLGTLRVGADAGVARLASSRAPSFGTVRRTRGIARLRMSGAVSPLFNFGIGASRAPFDETAVLIANGLLLTEIEGETAISLPARLSLSSGGGYARVTGGLRDNSRVAVSSALRWTASRRWSVAVAARRFGYDTATADGYFAPRSYTLAEGSVRAQLGRDLGWVAEADAALGTQRIQFFGLSRVSRRAERFAASIGYRFDPAREITLSGSYANTAGPGQAGNEYRGHSISLRARTGF